jgi:hypothetical protein
LPIAHMPAIELTNCARAKPKIENPLHFLQTGK